MSSTHHLRSGAPGACCPGATATPLPRLRPQPLQKAPLSGGSRCGAPSPAGARGSLLVAQAATGLGGLYQSEWELYKAESDFNTRAIGVGSIIRQLAQTFRQEWEMYRAEWDAQARLVEGITGAAKAQVAQPAAISVTAALEQAMSADFCPGGYHPVMSGDEFHNGRYTALHQLGQGHYSTVWMARDAVSGQQVAIKIVRSAESYTAAARREVSLLQPIRDNDPFGNASHCVRLLDSFEHDGPNGRHVVEVFEAMGDDLLALIRAYDFSGVPLPIVRHLVRQTLVAVDYLHSKCNIIHTDLKPENVVLTETLQPRNSDTKLDRDELEPRLLGMGCKILDFGNACWRDQHYSEDIQTRPYRSPEVILGAGYADSADMWSLGCMVWELVTGDYLFQPRGEGEGGKDVEQLAQMIARLGDLPPHIASHGSNAATYFCAQGHLLQPGSLPRMPLDRVLSQQYNLAADEAAGLRDFLMPMLEFDPAKRASAAEMLDHPWLRGELPAEVMLNNISTGRPGGVVERSLRVKWGSPKQSPSAVASAARSNTFQ